jgi:hypothetical protein
MKHYGHKQHEDFHTLHTAVHKVISSKATNLNELFDCGFAGNYFMYSCI